MVDLNDKVNSRIASESDDFDEIQGLIDAESIGGYDENATPLATPEQDAFKAEEQAIRNRISAKWKSKVAEDPAESDDEVRRRVTSRFMGQDQVEGAFEASKEGRLIDRAASSFMTGANQLLARKNVAESKFLIDFRRYNEDQLAEAQVNAKAVDPDDQESVDASQKNIEYLQNSVERIQDQLMTNIDQGIEIDNSERARQEAKTLVNPQLEAYQSNETGLREKLSILRKNPSVIGVDLLPQMLPDLAIGAAGAGVASTATQGATKAVRLASIVASQGVVEGVITQADEFVTAIKQAAGNSMDWQDRDAIAKLYENQDLLTEAYNKSLRGGAAGAATGMLSTMLAGLKIIPLSAISGSIANRSANAVAQVSGQAGLGAANELSIALAAQRETSTADVLTEAIFGVASGAVDSVAIARGDINSARAEREAEAETGAADGRQEALDRGEDFVAFGDNIDRIYSEGSSQIDLDTDASLQDAKDNADRALDDYLAISEDPLSTLEVKDAARNEAAVARRAHAKAYQDAQNPSPVTEDPGAKIDRETADLSDKELQPNKVEEKPEADSLFTTPEIDNGSKQQNAVEGDNSVLGQQEDNRQRLPDGQQGNVSQDGQFNEVGPEQEVGLSGEDLKRAGDEALGADENLTGDDFKPATETVDAPVTGASPEVRESIESFARGLAKDSNGNLQAARNSQEIRQMDSDMADFIDNIQSSGASVVRGVYSNKTGRMHMLTDNMTSLDDAKVTAIHEASHKIRLEAGANSKFNAREDIKELIDAIGGLGGIRDYANEKGIDLSHYEGRFANDGPQAVHNMTEELIAQIHGKESGATKQIARRILSKFEGVASKAGIDVWSKTNPDQIDVRFQKIIANTERGIRNRKILTNNFMGVIAPGKADLTAPGALADSAANAMFGMNTTAMRDANRRLNTVLEPYVGAKAVQLSQWWQTHMQVDGGMGGQAHMARVRRDGSRLDSANQASYLKMALDDAMDTHIPNKRLHARFRKRYNKYLTNPADKGIDIQRDVRDTLDVMRHSVDVASERVVNVLNEQVQSRVNDLTSLNPDRWKDLQADIDTYRAAPVDDRVELAGQLDVPANIIRNIDMGNTIASNTGKYMTVAYRAFNDPDYAKSVLDNPELVTKYSGYLLAMQPDITTMDEARGELKSILTGAEGGANQFGFGKGGTEAGIGSKGFKRKHLEDARMQEILGIFDDVTTNFVNSLEMLDGIHIQHTFQTKLMEAFIPMGVVQRQKTRTLKGDESITQPLMSEDSMSVMNGWYASDVIASSLEFQMSSKDLPELLQKFLTTGAMINYGKTILSPATHAGNYTSNWFIKGANGHAFYTQAVEAAMKDGDIPLNTLGHFEGWKILKDMHFGEGAARTDARNKYSELAKQGLVSESVDLNELSFIMGQKESSISKALTRWQEDRGTIAEILEAVKDKNIADAARGTVGNAADKAVRLNQLAKTLYAMEDDIFKMQAYSIELDKAKRYKGLDGQEAKDYASTEVRDGYMMYGQVNRLVKEIQRLPGVGLFISFPAEMIRTAKNQLRMAARDFVDSDLPLSLRGNRLLGTTIAYKAPAIIAGLSASMVAGLSDEEQDAMREALPPWQKQNDLIFLPRYENGDPRFLDVSRNNPYSMFIKSYRELAKTNDDTFLSNGSNLVDAATELAGSFVSPNILTMAAVELMTGQKMSNGLKPGGLTYNPSDDALERWVDRGLQFAWKAAPGGFTQGKNIFDASTNDKTWYGGEEVLVNEVVKMIGLNIGRFDRDVALRFYASDFKNTKRNSRALLNRPMNDLSTAPEYSELRDLMAKRMEGERKNYENGIKMIVALKGAGLDDAKIQSVLKSQGVPKKDVAALISGEIPQLTLSGKEGLAGKNTALALADTDDDRVDIEQEYSRRMSLLDQAFEELSEGI